MALLLPDNSDNKSLLLMNGYVRTLQSQNAFSLQIPIDIITLCFRFYFIDIHPDLYLYAINNDEIKLFFVHLKTIKSNYKNAYSSTITKYSLKPRNDSNTKLNKAANLTEFGYCIVNNVLSLPKSIDPLQYLHYNQNNNLNNKNSNHSMLIRCGGLLNFSNYTNECDAIYFDKNNINNNEIQFNHYILPSYPFKSCSTSLIYHNNYLYGVGGQIGSRPKIRSLLGICCLNLNNNDNKWKLFARMRRARRGTTLSIIPDTNKLMIIGGCIGSNGFFRDVEMLELNHNISSLGLQTNKLSSTTFNRYNSGCVSLRNNNRIIIGGGYGGWWIKDKVSETMEIYDVHKNKWYVHPSLMNTKHPTKPVMWSDNNDQIIFIAGDKFESKSQWVEWIDLRDSNLKWNILWNDCSIQDIFGLCNNDKCRALIV